MTETPTQDLAAWLTAVWDEREKACREAQEAIDTYSATAASGTLELRWMLQLRKDGVFQGGWDMPGPPTPTEDLARIASDRKILALHTGPHDCTVLVTGTYSDDWPEYIPWGKAGTEWRHPSNEYFDDLYCPTARHLAESHKDRPGFRAEWLVERQGVER